MKTDNHNDWTDAFRESFPEEARPEAGGWEAVAGRMRRAAARRRAALAAAALALPIAAGILFLPSRPDGKGTEIAVAPAPVIPGNEGTELAVAEAPVIPDATSVIPSATSVIPSEAKESASSDLTAEVTARVETDSFVGLRPPQNDNNDVIPGEAKESDSSDPTPTITNTVTEVASDVTAVPEDVTAVRENVTAVPGNVMPGPDRASLTPGDLPDLFAEAGDAPARARRLAIGLGAAATAGGTPATVTTTTMASGIATKASNNYSGNFFNNSSGTILQHDYVHDLPVSLGLSARYGMTDRIWLESGVEFTRMHSRLDGLHTVMYYAGIPLRVNYSLFSTSRFEAYAGLGGKAEKCLKATLGGMKVSEPELQWSGSVLVGAQARLAGNAWIYLQPDLTYYFTKSALVSYRTENRLGLSFCAGLRFDIASR